MHSLTIDAELERIVRLIPNYDPFRDAGDCVFVEERAIHVIEFFEECLTHVKGRLAGQPFILQDWQKAILANLFGWYRPNGTRRYTEGLIYIPRKNGKMEELSTPLPTPSGWTTMGDIRVGDVVFDELGLPCNVVHISEIDEHPESYLIKFSNKEKVRACADHQWVTTAKVDKPGDKSSGRTKRPLTRVRTTKEIYDTQLYGKRQDRNHTIAMPEALHLPEARLLIDPYVLGTWLGDGTSRANVITCAESDAAHLCYEFEGAGYELSRRETKLGKASQFSIRVLMQGLFGPVATTVKDRDTFASRLRLLKVFGNKHIPAVYLRASISQRLALLQGLMDTDGTADKRGCALEFVSVLPALRDGFCELLATLGIKYRCREKRANLEGRVTGPSFRIQFFVSPDFMPAFRMERKLERLPRSDSRSVSQRSRNVSIVSVEPCEPTPMRCIAVDSPSNLYRFGRTMLPTHNTTISAGIPIYLLTTDRERGKEIYVAAADEEQAKQGHEIAKQMIVNEPLLDEACNIYKGSIVHPATHSFYKAISRPQKREAGSKHGYDASAVIVDELHAQPDRHLVDALETSVGSRENPLVLHITTADFYRDSICNEKHRYASKVRDGIIPDDGFLPVIYEATLEDDWTDPEVWEKANPNLGVSVRREYFERQFKKAEAEPLYENTFKRLHLNIMTEQEDRFLPVSYWLDCTSRFDEEDLEGEPCYAGLDLSSTQDVTAFVLYFPTCSHRVLPFFWCPHDVANKRERETQAKYLQWAQRGLVTLCSGGVIDYNLVVDTILQLASRFKIRNVGYDPWNSQQSVNQLEAHGVQMTKMLQGFPTMNSPTKSFERLVLKNEIRHNGNDALTWMFCNLSVDTDHSGNVKPSKKKSTEKIDGIVALIMAIGVAELEVDEPNPYNERGFRSL